MSLKQEYLTQLKQLQQWKLNHPQEHDDPDDQLLEGIAFLTAKMKQEWQLGLRDLQQVLLRQLAPDLTRPFPAMTLLQFNGMTAAVPVSVGTSFQSTIDQEWQVQTTDKQTLFPITFTTELRDNVWQVSFTATHACELSFRDLPLTIIAPHTESQAWLHHLMTQTLWITVNGKRVHDSWNGQWRDPYSTMLKYFHSPALLYRFYLDSDQRLSLVPGEPIKWIVRTRTAFPALPEDAFHLNIIPAQLIQTIPSDPIRVHAEEFDYPLTFSKPGILYNIDRVIAKNTDGQTQLCLPYRGDRSTLTPHYVVNVDSQQTTLKLITESLLTTKLISCDLRICREAASWVRSTFVSRSGNIPHYIQARNLTRPTRCFIPPWHSGQGTERVILSGLLQSTTQLLNDNLLSEFLNQFHWNSTQRLSLDVIRTSYRSIVDRGILYRILRVECHAEESSFQHRSQAWLFAQVLKNFLEHLLEIGMRADIILDWQNEQVTAP